MGERNCPVTSPVRVVLDTNCVVSALLFSAGRLSRFRRLWQQGEIIPVVCKATILELYHVLAYPKFSLSRTDIDDLLVDYIPWTETYSKIITNTVIPELRDEKDNFFISLAIAANTDYLISGDKHLVELKEIIPSVRIVSPSAFLEIYAGQLSG
ncbi:MAG: putative toxin-antitoxin system toxin component, PIN family [Bacteroidaceae bacterium]|nr:putative toxin-antitoxin system toxin component, PIN family [Bacteroidaceae bacterium]